MHVINCLNLYPVKLIKPLMPWINFLKENWMCRMFYLLFKKLVSCQWLFFKVKSYWLKNSSHSLKYHHTMPMIKIKLKELICKKVFFFFLIFMQKGLCQPLSHKFPQNNIDGLFIDLILHAWMTPRNEISGSALTNGSYWQQL